MWLSSLPVAVYMIAAIWIMLSIAFPTFRNLDTNPIILNTVKLLVLIGFAVWFIVSEIQYRKQMKPLMERIASNERKARMNAPTVMMPVIR